MAQTQNEHLTTEQISASFDMQLSPQQQAVFDAHISSCQQCQNKLSDLRMMTALLRSLPVEEVPRSFVLPDNVSILAGQTIRQDAPVTALRQRQRPQRSVLARSVRIVSTLAAVLALCFIISGILPLVYSGVGNSVSTTSSSSSFGEANTAHPTVIAPGAQQPKRVLPPVGSAATTPPTETAHSLSPTGTSTTLSRSEHSANSSHTIPPAIDLSQPVTRLGTGVLVLAMSIIGLIVTRRRRAAVH